LLSEGACCGGSEAGERRSERGDTAYGCNSRRLKLLFLNALDFGAPLEEHCGRVDAVGGLPGVG